MRNKKQFDTAIPCLVHKSVQLFVLIIALSLAATATPLEQSGQECPIHSLNPSASDRMASGRCSFHLYKLEKRAEIIRKSGGYRVPSSPFALFHHNQSLYSILLIHGLNDSPFYMADLAETLHDMGFNVLTVLLPGHGTKTRDMLEITAEQWRTEVEIGLNIAALVGKNVIVGGFSLGGTLAIDAAIKHPEIKALLLFSPAVRLRFFDTLYGLACLPGIRSLQLNTKMLVNPIKYKYRSANGLCQVHRLLQGHLKSENSINSKKLPTFPQPLYQTAKQIRAPTFAVMTYEDARVSAYAIKNYVGRISAPSLLITFAEQPNQRQTTLTNGGEIIHLSNQRLPHSFLIRRTNKYNGQANPHYDKVVAYLLDFLARNLGLQMIQATSGLKND